MSEHISNLLIGTGTSVNSDEYLAARYKTTEPLVVGDTYTISAYVEELECDVMAPYLAVGDGRGYWRGGKLKGDIPGVQTLTFVYQQQFPDHADPNHILIVNTFPSSDAKRKAVLRNVMLVKGDAPAAWGGQML